MALLTALKNSLDNVTRHDKKYTADKIHTYRLKKISLAKNVSIFRCHIISVFFLNVPKQKWCNSAVNSGGNANFKVKKNKETNFIS